MKVLLLNFVPNHYYGVKKKINAQVESFSRLVDEVDVGQFENTGYVFNQVKIVSKFFCENNILRKIIEPILMFIILMRCRTSYDLVYMRYMRMTPWYFLFVFFISKISDKVVIEVPSYPYDDEYKDGFLKVVDVFFRNRLSKYVDLLVYFGDEHDVIWGIPSLKIDNAIDANEIPVKQEYTEEKYVIDIIAVANFSKWHGYDRLIESSAQYLRAAGTKKFHIHFVGEGPELSSLKSLSSKNSLDSYVTFYGSKVGYELDALFSNMDIGVGSLGLFRIGHDKITPLKPAEYTARGLKFILANDDSRFRDTNFCINVSNDESLLPLHDIFDWYQNTDISPKDMRKFALENLSWDSQISLILFNVTHNPRFSS